MNNDENAVNEVEAHEVEPTRSIFAQANEPAAVTDAPVAEVDATVETPVDAVASEEEHVADEEAQAAEEAEVAVADAEVGEVAEDTSEQPVEVVEPVEEPQEAAVEPEPEAVEEQPQPAEEASVAEEGTKSLTDLQAEKSKLDAQITKKQKAERSAVINQIAVVVKTYDIPIAELVEALGGLPNPRKGIKAPVLYKDDKGNKWSGRGKLPNWLKDKNPEDYKVK